MLEHDLIVVILGRIIVLIDLLFFFYVLVVFVYVIYFDSLPIFLLFENRNVISTPSLMRVDARAIAYIVVTPEPPAKSPILVF